MFSLTRSSVYIVFLWYVVFLSYLKINVPGHDLFLRFLLSFLFTLICNISIFVVWNVNAAWTYFEIDIFSNVSLLPHGLMRPTNVSSMIIYSLFPTNCPEQSSFKFRFTNQFKRSAKNRFVRINIKLPNWNSAWGEWN